MKTKQKTIGVSPLDYYLSYNTQKDSDDSNTANNDHQAAVEHEQVDKDTHKNMASAADTEKKTGISNLNTSPDEQNQDRGQPQISEVESPVKTTSFEQNMQKIMQDADKLTVHENKKVEKVLTHEVAENSETIHMHAEQLVEVESPGAAKQQALPISLKERIDEMVMQETKIKKERVTIHVPAGLIDQVKNAVYWEPGLTLAGFAEIALERFLGELVAERGEPFPQRRRHRLAGGRPLK